MSHAPRLACLALAVLAGCLSTSRPCDQVEDEARALRATLATCDPDAPGACVLERMSGGSCVTSFRCTVALNRDWRRLDTHGRVERLEHDKQSCGGDCPSILCASDQDRHAACNPSTRQCEIVQNTDAGSR